MESRRLLLAVALSILVYVIFTSLWGPKPPERPTDRTEAVPVPVEEMLGEPPDAASSPETAEAMPAEPELAAGPAVQAARVETLSIVTDVAEIELTNQGGRALSWKLRDWAREETRGLEVWPRFEQSDLLPLGLEVDNRRLTATLNAALYRVERKTVTIDNAEAEQVVFTWADGRGVEARKAFTFRRDSYLVDVELDVSDRDVPLDARLTLGPGFAAQDPDEERSNYYYAGQAVWRLRGQVERTRQKDLDDVGQVAISATQSGWAGLEDQYFAALVIPADSPWGLSLIPVERSPLIADEEAETSLEPIVAVSVGQGGGQLFVGPKKYRLLREQGHQLEEVVYFSRFASLAWISRQIYLGLLWIHDNVAGNYGLAIVLATVVLRLLLFPVNQYSMVAMKKSQLQMQRLQPKIKAIRNKYKKTKDAQSRAKMNQEMMDLYKREGINPMGGVTGCLPLFAQFPILIGFYNMLTVAVELKGAPFFGWIQDLSLEDPFYITPLLMGVTMFTQQKMAMSKIKDPQQLQQQRIMLFMPVMFTFICIGLPSGLVLYWFVNNLLGMGQQWLVNRHTGRLEAAAQKA
jgi:YidC/Oxa1 family membrane protein insertase